MCQRCDLEELVSWIGDGPENPNSHADATLWESPQPLRRSAPPPSSPLETPTVREPHLLAMNVSLLLLRRSAPCVWAALQRSAADADETPSDAASVRSYAHTGPARLFMDPTLAAEQVD